VGVPAFRKRVFARVLLGIDIGGSKLALALGTGDGRVTARRRRPTTPTGDAARDVAAIVADVRDLLAEASVPVDRLDCIGVSAPGPIHPESGRILGPPNLPGWDDVPLVSLLADALGRPVHLENDANAGALAEWRFGAGRGRRDVAFLTVSTGIGGGLVLGGRLHRGAGWNAGEIGHVAVEPGGEPCDCGLRGCLEAYVGGRAWTRRLRERAPATSRAVALAGARAALLPEHVVAAAGEGDPFALSELARFNEYLARGIAILAFVIAPEVVVLGTIATAAGAALCLDPVRRGVAERVWPGVFERLEIVPAALGEDAPYLAALCVANEGLAAAQSEPSGPEES
jgi:glucokinase